MKALILTEADRERIRKKLGILEPPINAEWRAYLKGLGASTERVGELITYARYGDFPKTGKSKMWLTLGREFTSYPELKGISVFEVKNGFEIYPKYYPKSLFDRTRTTGRGVIVGWGTDGEPLLELSLNPSETPNS